MILLRISLRILIGFYKDFTNFYGFVKKMVQKNQYTYNVPPGPSDYIYNEARRAELGVDIAKIQIFEKKSFCVVFCSMHIKYRSYRGFSRNPPGGWGFYFC